MEKGGICIITAMEREHKLLSSSFMDSSLCGIGKVNAALACERIIREKNPRIVISTGCAGGMSDTLKVGDIVVASEVAYHDVWCGEGNLWGQVQGLPQRFACAPLPLSCEGLHKGLIVSGDQFFISLEEDRKILSRFPDALAADMESAAIAQVCHMHGIPFISIRTISDVHTPETEHCHAAHYESFWDECAKRSFDLISELLRSL